VGTRTLFILGLLWAGGCAGVEESSFDPNLVPSQATPSTCTDVGKYNNDQTCRATTQAACETTWQVLPSGGISQCYQPVAGGEACINLFTSLDPNLVPHWIYSTGSTWCQDAGNTNLYRRYQSLVGCSNVLCDCNQNLAIPYTLVSTVYCLQTGSGTDPLCSGFSPGPTGTEALCP
jgi:hypothetical protein